MDESQTKLIAEGLIDGLGGFVIPHPHPGIPPVRKSMKPDYCAGFDVGETWRRVAHEWEEDGLLGEK